MDVPAVLEDERDHEDHDHDQAEQPRPEARRLGPTHSVTIKTSSEALCAAPIIVCPPYAEQAHLVLQCSEPATAAPRVDAGSVRRDPVTKAHISLLAPEGTNAKRSRTTYYPAPGIPHDPLL